MADSASGVANQGGAMATDVMATMCEINASLRIVSEIIGVTDGAAFQANILAPDATVKIAHTDE